MDRLAQLIDDVPDAVVIVDGTGTIIYANASCQPVLGYLPDELIGRNCDVLIPEPVRERHHAHVARFFGYPEARAMGAGVELSIQRRDGQTVPVEIALVPLRDESGAVAACVRDISVGQALIDRLRTKDDLITALLFGMSLDEWLEKTAGFVCELVDADAARIGLVTRGGRTVEIVASAGEVAGLCRGAEFPIGDLGRGDGWQRVTMAANIVPREGARLFPPELRMGPVAVLRLCTDLATVGAIVVARRHDRQSFSVAELDLIGTFSDIILVAIERTHAEEELTRLAVVEDHDRIARELHDKVIQQLFALGLRLAAAIPTSSGATAERLRTTVQGLDDVIADIRTAIFDLHTPKAGQGSFRRRVLERARDVADLVGFEPRVRFVGEIEAAITKPQGENLLTVLREALSNVVQHANASAVEITVDVSNDEISLTVVDDGHGPDHASLEGLGLNNLHIRAAALGGTFAIEPHPVSGTVVRWRVPQTTAFAQ